MEWGALPSQMAVAGLWVMFPPAAGVHAPRVGRRFLPTWGRGEVEASSCPVHCGEPLSWCRPGGVQHRSPVSRREGVAQCGSLHSLWNSEHTLACAVTDVSSHDYAESTQLPGFYSPQSCTALTVNSGTFSSPKRDSSPCPGPWRP